MSPRHGDGYVGRPLGERLFGRVSFGFGLLSSRFSSRVGGRGLFIGDGDHLAGLEHIVFLAEWAVRKLIVDIDLHLHALFYFNCFHNYLSGR